MLVFKVEPDLAAIIDNNLGPLANMKIGNSALP
jgi:hypothetical protein